MLHTKFCENPLNDSGEEDFCKVLHIWAFFSGMVTILVT